MIGAWLALAAAAQTTPATVSPARIAVHVRTFAGDATARRFQSAVLKELGRDPRLAIVGEAIPAAVTLSLPRGVGWERSIDWIRILYQARLDTPQGGSYVIHGECWNWNQRECGKQIADAVAEAGLAAAPRH